MPAASPFTEPPQMHAPAPAVQQMYTPPIPPALVTLPETRTFEALQEVRIAPEMLGEPQATASPWSTPASEMPTFESVESVPVSPAEDIRWATSEVLQPDRSTKASVSGYFEWTGQSTQEGSWKLRDEAPEELRRGGEVPAKSEATAPAFVDDTYPQLPPRLQAAPPGAPGSPAAPMTSSAPMKAAPDSPAPASPSFESHFPHFVGRPVEQLEGRVEVSFEGTPRERPEARRREGSAKPPAPEGTPVFDIRSLGALEFDE